MRRSAAFLRRSATVWLVTLLVAFGDLPATAADPSNCAAPAPGEIAYIASVIDGDTVVLSDSTHVRLIGIDTPEIGHHGSPSEPGAIDARAFLAGLLRRAGSVQLVHDAEPWDRYGRRLAYLFSGGTNVEARMLEEGVAVPLTMPPNVLFVDCYRDAVAAARQAKRGLWALPAYAPVDVQELAPDTRGYRVVHGRLRGIGHGDTSMWLEFTPQFAAWIAAQDLGYFGTFDFKAQLGKLVWLQGRVYAVHGQLRMRVRHPLDFGAISETH